MVWIINFFCGLGAMAIAKSKGRSMPGWFLFGFFFGIFALIAVLLVSNLKEQIEKFEQMEHEQRRLHEQLRQERMKNEQFRKHTQARLDVHDENLGIETKTAGTPILAASEMDMLSDPAISQEEASLEEPIIPDIDNTQESNPVIEDPFKNDIPNMDMNINNGIRSNSDIDKMDLNDDMKY